MTFTAFHSSFMLEVSIIKISPYCIAILINMTFYEVRERTCSIYQTHPSLNVFMSYSNIQILYKINQSVTVNPKFGDEGHLRPSWTVIFRNLIVVHEEPKCHIQFPLECGFIVNYFIHSTMIHSSILFS